MRLCYGHVVDSSVSDCLIGMILRTQIDGIRFVHHDISLL